MNAMKPILFNTDMVRAILAGLKTVTRRVVKPQPRMVYYDGLLQDSGEDACDGRTLYVLIAEGQNGSVNQIVPPYQPSDILYVRETWTSWSRTYGTISRILYKADRYTDAEKIKWHPSIHMPRKAARIFLRVTDVRVERLQEITEMEAEKEGLRYYDDICQDESWSPTFYDPDSGGDPSTVKGFSCLWDSTIKKAGRGLYNWGANPWVWVIEFEQYEKPEGG